MKTKQYRLGETTWISVVEHPDDELFFNEELGLHFQKEWLLKMGAVPIGDDKPQLPEKLDFDWEYLQAKNLYDLLEEWIDNQNQIIGYLEKREE